VRKRVLGHSLSAELSLASTPWIDLPSVASAEISSEEPGCEIECALIANADCEWRASMPGNQLLRLIFDVPQQLQHIHLLFHERNAPRTQEFVLRWWAKNEQSSREIVRQQYTFSPPGTTSEVEDYRVDLHGVTTLELEIKPDISGSPAYASLAKLLLA